MNSVQPVYAVHDLTRSHIVEFCAAQLIYVAAGRADAKQIPGNPAVPKSSPSESVKPRCAAQDSNSRALIL
jgi:hypothetical protein